MESRNNVGRGGKRGRRYCRDDKREREKMEEGKHVLKWLREERKRRMDKGECSRGDERKREDKRRKRMY